MTSKRLLCMCFSISAFFSSVAHANMSDSKQTLSEFLWTCPPSQEELFADTFVISGVDYCLRWVGWIEDDSDKANAYDPTERAFVVDMSKIASTFWKVARGAEVGGTGYTFDSSYIMAQLVKTGLKAKARQFKDHKTFMTFLSSCLGQTLTKIGKDRQKSKNTDEWFFAYAYRNFDSSWIVRSLTENFPKTITTHALLWVLGKTGLAPFFAKAPSYLVSYLSGTKLFSDYSLTSLNKNREILQRRLPAYIALPTAVAVAGTSALSKCLVDGYILVTGGRLATQTSERIWESIMTSEESCSVLKNSEEDNRCEAEFPGRSNI